MQTRSIDIPVFRHLELLNEEIEDDDNFVKQMNENVAFFEKFRVSKVPRVDMTCSRIVKKVYILGSHPLYNLNFLSNFLHYLTQKPDEIESLHLDKTVSDRCWSIKNVVSGF